MSITETKEVELARMARAAEIAREAAERAVLEERHGRVWSTDEMQEDFEPIGFAAPLIVVRRRSDGAKGSLEFQHNPRFYFNFRT